MNIPVVIIGASGHGKVIADIIQKSGDIIKGFLDDNEQLSSTFIGFPILGQVSDYPKHKKCKFVIAIGDAHIREKIVNQLSDVSWYTAIHPTAVISEMGTSIEKGTVIMANATIGPYTQIGKHCIINTGAIVEHDNHINDYTHISVGAKVAGTVTIGKSSWIGIGTSINNNITICSNCMIGAGAIVVDNIDQPGTYVGVPARKIK